MSDSGDEVAWVACLVGGVVLQADTLPVTQERNFYSYFTGS